MSPLLLAVAAWAGGPCPLAVVVPGEGVEVVVEGVAVGSLVRRRPDRDCEEGVAVDVVARDGWIRLPEGEPLGPGTGACLPEARLASLEGRHLLVQGPPPRFAVQRASLPPHRSKRCFLPRPQFHACR